MWGTAGCPQSLFRWVLNFSGKRAAYDVHGGAHGNGLQAWPGISLGRMIASSQFMKTCTRCG
jgi:hypothetical protein